MDVILLLPQRTVEFYGLRLVVPHDTRWLTLDCLGNIVAHGGEDMPWSEVEFWESNDELGVIGVTSVAAGVRWMHTYHPFYVGEEQ